MKSSEDRKRKILRAYSREYMLSYPVENKIANAEDKALTQLNAIDKQRCKDCKEEKLNTVAKHFKKYNKTLKSRIDEGKLSNIIHESLGEDCYGYCDNLAREIAKGKEDWLK